ncbi:uncharacterized protein futsch [Dermacentor andersoni]|uniref:uncharacterized protein futsch n=1 Tax=Dermacentor andersoni TaxID=34620 RepID=UPI002415AA95|nr:microtubule-associated protein futsch-like [Dermacentor andersoni]
MGGGGGYLLLVLNPPWTPEHKEAILQRVAKGLLSWDVKATGTDLASAEKACLSVKVSAGPHNELLIQHSTESLALEVLLNPEVSTLRQCFKNMMVSGTTHKHVIHAGYAFAGSGDWILQDGVFSARDVEALLHDADVQEVLRRQKFHTLHVHCSAEGSWAQPPVGVSLNPPDIADSLAGSVHLLGCLDAVLTSPPLTSLLPSSSVVGNIRFRRPTMYVFPGGQGDCALFGVTGFTLLVDGGFARKPCFWEFVRHLDRLDSLLVTRFNQFNSCGLTALAQRKALERVYPQVGHVFCNAVRSPSDEELQKDRDQLVVSVVAQGLEFLQGVREMGLSPQACQRDARPLTLYHKVGHGTLEMFVLSPGRSTEEDASVCALLVWRPAKVSEPVTRILLPGSASQNVIFEGLSKLGHLAVLKSRAVTAEARLGLKKSKVQDKPLRATSVPPRPSVAKRAAAKVESPSPSPTPPPAEKVRAPVKQTNKSIESLPKKQDDVKKPSKTGAKKEPKKSAVEKADAKDEKAPKITAKVPAKVSETIPGKEKIVEKLGENELDNVEEKDISKIISDKPLKKLPIEIEKIDTKAQEEIVAKVEEKVAAKRELKKATPTRPPAKSKGAKDVTNKMAVESKTTARKTAEPAKVKPRPLVAPLTRPMVRDSKSKSPSSSASSSPKRTPPKPTTERPVRSVRGGVRNAKAPAAETVKLPEGEKPVLIEKPTAQVKPDKRIEVVTQSGDESSGSKEAIEEKAATEATKEDKPFIEPSSSDESKKDIPKQKSPVTVDEAPIKAVLLGTAHAAPTTDFQAVPTKPLEKDIADAKTWPAEGDAKEVAETPEHALSPEPTVSASSEGVPSLIDEVIDVSLKADSSVARQITEPELSRVRALSSGQRTPDSLDTPREVGDGTAPSSRDEILEAMEKHQLVSREQVLEIKRRDSVDSIEGEIPMEDEEIVHPSQEADKKTAGVPISAHVGQELPEPDDQAELKQKFQQPTQHAADLPSHDIEHATDEPSKRSPEEPCAEPAMVEKSEGVVLDTAKEKPSAVGMLDTADKKICDAEIIAKAEPQIETSAPEISVSAAKDIAQKEPPELTGTTEAEPMTKQLKEESVLSTVPETSDKKPSEPSGIEPETPTDDTKQADLHEMTEKPSEPSVIETVEQVIESPSQKTPESKVSEDAEEKPAKLDATDKIKLEFERTKQEIPASEVPEVMKTKPAGPESIEKLEPAIEKPTEETTKTAVFEVTEKLLGESEIMQKVEQDIERLTDESRVSSVPEVREKSAEPDGIEKAEPEFERQAEKTPVSAVPEFAEKKPAKPEGVQKAEPGIDIPDEETTISAVPDVAAKKPAEPEGVQKEEPDIERPAEGSPLRAVPDVAEKPAEPESVEKGEPDIGTTGQDTFVSVVPVFLEKQPTEPESIQMVEPEIAKPAEDTPVSAVPDVTEKKAVESEGFQKGEPAIQRPTEETPARSLAEAVQKPTEPESIEKVKPEIKIPAEEAPVSTVPEATEKKLAEPESIIMVEPETERPSEDTSGATVHAVEEKKPAEPESIDKEKQKIERPPQETPLSGEPEVAEKAAESEGDLKVEPEVGRLAEEPSMSEMPEVTEEKPTEPESVEKIEPVTERLAEETPVRAVSQVPKKPAQPEGFQTVDTELVQPDVETPFEPDGVQKVEPATERPAEKTPESSVMEVAKKKPSEADGVQEIEPEIEISAEETSVSKALDATEKKPVERDGVEQMEPLPERHAEEAPVSSDFEVADIKPAETEDDHEVELEIERLPDETAISGVFEVIEKKPVETDGVIKVEQEVEKPSQETPISAVPEVVEKKPPERDSAGKVEADIERPADKTSVGAVPEVAERKPPIREDLQEVEPEIEKPAEKTPMSVLQEVTEKTPTEPDDARKVEPKTERHDEETPVSPVPGEADKKPTERQSPIKAEPEIQRPVEETPMSALPAVQVKQPSELEDLQKDEPEIERPAEQTPVSVELAVAERTPAELEGFQEVEPDIEKPAEKSPTSVVPEVAKKPTEHGDAQKDKPEIERLAEETAASAVPEVAEKEAAEPEGVQKIEPKIEKPAEATPVSPVPEVVDKKPTERESAIKVEPEIEGPVEESPVSAVPEVAEKQPAEPEGLQNVETDFERPAEETPVSFVPEAVEKKPTEPETFGKMEPEFERPTEETPVSGVRAVAERTPAVPEGLQEVEPEIEKSAEKSPRSAVPEVGEKKPTEHDEAQKGKPEIKGLAEETAASAMPEVAEKKPAEPDGVQKVEPKIEKPDDEAPVSPVPKAADKKPAERESVLKVEPEIEGPAEESPVSAVPEVAEKQPAEPEGLQKFEPYFEKPAEETPVSSIPEAVEKIPTESETTEKVEPRVERPAEETPVSGVPAVAGRTPTVPEGLQEVEPEIEKSAEKSPTSAVPEVAEKKPTKHDDAQKGKMEIERLAEDTAASAVPEVAEKKPAEPEGVQKIEPKIEKPAEATPVSPVPEVVDKKPTERESAIKVEPEIEGPVEESPVSAVPQVAEKQAAEPGVLQKVKPEIERPADETPVSSVPEAVEKKPTEPQSAGKVEPEIERPAEETPVSGVPAVAEITLAEPEGLQEVELEIEKSAEKSPTSAVPEVAEKKPTKHDDAQKGKMEIERLAEDTAASAVPEVAEKKPAEPEGVQKIEPKIEKPAEATPVSPVPEVVDKKPTERESAIKVEPEIEGPVEESPVSAVPQVAEKQAAEPGVLQKVKPEIERPADETPVSSVPEAVEKKPTEPQSAGKVEPEIERPAEETPVSGVPAVAEITLAEPEGLQEVELEIEKSAEKSPTSAVPEVAEKKPTEHDYDQKGKPDFERLAEETAASAMPEVTEKEPTEPEGVTKFEPKIEKPAEATPVSPVPEVVDKKPTERESAIKVEPEIEGPVEESPVSAVPEVAEKQAAEPGVLQKVKPEIEKPADETPVSSVPEAVEKKPTEPQTAGKVEPEVQRPAEETPVSGVPAVAEITLAEPEGLQEVELEIEKSAEKSPTSAVPEVAEKKPTEHDYDQKGKPDFERLAEETAASAMPEVTEKEPTEPEGVTKFEPKIEKPAEATPVSPVPEVVDKKPTERESAIKVEPEIEGPVEESPVSAVPEVAEKQAAEPGVLQKVKPEIEKPADETPVSSVPEAVEKKPTEPQTAGKVEPEIQRPAEETPVSGVPAVAEITLAEPEGLQEVELEIEKSAEKSPTSAVPEVAEKKPTEHDYDQKGKPDFERLAEETAASAMPEVTEKEPTEPEGVTKFEPKIEKPAEATPVSPVPEVVDKKPTERESAIKVEPEIEGPVEESPVSAVPEVAEKQAAEPEGLQNVEPDFERPAEGTPVSSVPEAVEKKPTEPETAGKVEPEIERPAEETTVGVVPAVAEKTPAEPEGLQEVEPDIEKPAEKSPTSVVPEVAEKKPTERDHAQKDKPEIESLAEETAASAVPEVAEEKPAEPEGVEKIETKIEEPAEETPVSPVPEVVGRKPTKPDEVHEVEPKIEGSGPPEQEKSVPASRELATTEQKPASPSAHIEVFEEVTPETSLSTGSGSITRDLSKTRDDGSALPDSNISQSFPADESSVNLSEEKVHHFPLDLDASSATDLSSSPVALKKSAGHPDLRTMSDKEPESATEIPSADLEMMSEKSDVCDARLSSEPEGTKVRDEASYGETGEKQTATSGSPPLIHQEQDSYEPEAPWIHHRGSQDVPSLEISDQPMKDPRATCPTSLDAPELAHMQQRMSVEYESSITSVSDIEFAIDAKTFRSVASEGSWHDDSKTAECSKGVNDASRPSSPESPPKSPVKRIAAEHPRTSKRARTTSESKHPIATQGSSEADISSEDEDSARKVIAPSYTDAPSYGAEQPKESPQSAHSSPQAGLHPLKDKPLEGDEYCVLPRGAAYSGSRHPPLEMQPDSLPHFSDKTEGLYFAHKRTPSEDYLPIAESSDEAKKNGKGSEAPELASQHVADSSSSTKPSEHDVQVPPSLLEPEKAKMSGETGSHLDETYSSQLKRSSIESETTSSSDDAGSGRRSLTGSKDSDLMREYTRHLETSPSARFSVDSTCSVTSEERSYTELEKPYQKDDSRESFSSTVRDHPDQSSGSGSLYSDSTIEPFSSLDHQKSIAPHISTEQVELSSSADALPPVKHESPTQVAKMEQQSDALPTSTVTSEEMESDVEVPLCEETVTREPDGHISSAAKIPMMEARQPVTVVAHGHGIASGLFAALKTELCVIDSPSMDTVLVQTGKDAQGLSDQGVFDTSSKFSQGHRELDSSEIKIPETEREAPTDQARSDDCKIGTALHTSGITPDKESKETCSVSGDDEALPGRKVSGEVTPVKALRFQLGDDSFIEPLADHTDTSASCTSFDADHGLSKEVFERKVRLEKFLEAEFLETMATDEEEESSRASVKPSTTSITSSSHQENGRKVAEPKDDVTDDGVTLASGLSSGLPTELVCMAQSSVDLSKDITLITKCADSQERVSPPPTSPLDAVKQDEPAAVAAGLASGLPVELVCMVESRELCSEIKRAEEEAIHHVIEKKADYAEEDDGVAMQAYIERRLSDSGHFTDKQQRASPPSEIVSTSQHGMPTPERKPSKGFDELHLNGTSHSPPSVGLVAGLAAGLATELVCMPQSAEELCIDASESRWPPARGSRVEPIPPEMTASIYEELTEHTGEKPCSDTDTESVGQGAADSAVPHRMGQIPVQREVITTVTSRRVVYQHDGLPDTWDTSTFSEPPQHDTEDDSRRTTVTYVYRTYTSGEGDDKGDPTLSSGTLPSSRGEDGLPFDILRSTAERHPREEDIHDEGDHVTGTSSRSYVYTVSSDHSAPETFIRHTDDTETLHHPDSSIHSIAMDEVARITEMAAAAVSQSPNGWTVVHRSADSSSQRPLELTRPAELVERRNGHATHVTETRQIVYHPGSSAEFRFALGPSAEETCLPPEGSDPKTILEFMAAQTKQAAKEMLEEQPLYEEDEEAAQEQSSLSDASPLVEEPVFGKTLQPDYPELVELSAGNTPSEPPSPHSAAQDTRVRHNGEPSGTSSVQRMVVVEETEPTSTMAGGSEARRVVSYVEEPTTVVREEWVLESGRGAASHVISQSSMFQHEVLTREESTSAGTASSPASTGGDAVRFTTLHHLERDLGAAAGAVQRGSLKASMAAVQHEQLWSDAEGASGTEAPRDTVRELQTTSAEGQANGRRDGDAAAPFDIRDWGKPLGLPVPPDPSSKSSKTGGKKAGAAATPRDAADVVYVDLTYVPHHGDPGYCDAEFFSRVRARYYVLSGTNPSQQVLDALLEAKRGWGEPDAPVTVIPTYETDALCYWIAHNQKALEEHHIDVAPSASRCTINLQDHESSCAAYRLEF